MRRETNIVVNADLIIYKNIKQTEVIKMENEETYIYRHKKEDVEFRVDLRSEEEENIRTEIAAGVFEDMIADPDAWYLDEVLEGYVK